jgi:hypothetical protein
MANECPKCRALNADELRTCGRCGTALFQSQPQPRGAGKPPPSGISFRRDQVVAKRYTVLDMIGRGGMGCIYRVHDNTLNEEVALKTLLPQFARDKLVVERFYNEARIARQLSHPNICRVHDIGIDGEIMYISMEVLKGRSLRSILDKLGPGQRLPVRSTLHIIDQLCASLEYAHQYTVHRDIKPENVMVAPDGAVKLMDFGISKLVASSSLTSASVVMGTPQYMSPEQLKDSRGVDGRADLFSIGVVLYEMLTGNLPTGVPKPASQVMQEVPPSLDPIIAKCVEPDPANRYQSARELRDALRPIREVLQTGADLDEEKKPAKPGRQGALRKLAGAAVVLVILSLGGLGLVGAEKGRHARMAAIPAGTAATVSDPGVARTFEQRFAPIARHVEQLHADAAGAARPEDAAALRIGEECWDAAKRAAGQGREEEALRDALRALQCFTALTSLTPPGMVFIPPGAADVDGKTLFVEGFYIDQYEVTAQDYHDYVMGLEVPPAVGYTASGPAVSGVPFYWAQGYAAAEGKRIPTEAEWVWAAYGYEEYAGLPDLQSIAQASETSEEGEQPDGGNEHVAEPVVFVCGETDPAVNRAQEPTLAADITRTKCLYMGGNVREWTASPTSGQSDRPPSFGTVLVVRGALSACPLKKALESRSEAYYQDALPCLGFRCVQSVPVELPAP